MHTSFIVFGLAIMSGFASSAQAFEFQDVLNHDRQEASTRVIGKALPISQTDLQLTYDLQDLKLKSQRSVYLEIPKAYKNLTLDFVALTHRQDPNDERGECFGGGSVDCKPGYTSLEFFDNSQSQLREGWRFWGGLGSGPLNSKFAEIRIGRGETDNLYEWQKKGHFSVETKSSSRQPLTPLLARVRSLGPDQVRVQKVILKFLPPPAQDIQDVIFSSGFAFGDYATSSGRHYPGQPSLGDYGNALKLRSFEVPFHRNIPKDWSTPKGMLRIPLTPATRLIWLDLAVGDMKQVPPGADPEQYRGGSSLSVKRVRGDQVLEILMDDENIGTNGVMRALPANLSRVTAAGEFLEITTTGSSAKIMGIRLGTSR